MTRILGIDFETTGLDPKASRVIEVGACLWETNHIWGGAPLEMFSTLVSHGAVDLEPLPPEIMDLTGIDHFMLQNLGMDDRNVFFKLCEMARKAQFVVAHNAPFEQGMLSAWIPGWEQAEGFEGKLWIDTMLDLPDEKLKGTLTHRAADHRILNPFPHRALPDVLTMLTLLSKFDFVEVERHALAPTITLRVAFGYDPEKVAAIKALGGWRFHSETKEWRKDIKEFNLQAEIDKAHAAGFQPLALQKAGAA